MKLLEELNSILPKYSTTLPFSKKETFFLPFKIKDAKNLAIIMQEENKILAFSAMIDIIKRNCQDVNVNELCLADAEYLFLQIRSKSVDEMLNLVYQKNKIQVNINEIGTKNNLQEKIILVGKDIKITLKTPLVKDILKLKSFEKEELLKISIKNIMIKNEIYDCNKFISEELKELINNLPLSISNNIEEFFKNEPQLFLNLNLENETKEVAGILNFFTYR